MTQLRVTQYSFTRGELGADLDFRSDIELYQKGAKTLSNMLVIPQGGVVKRRGFEDIATVSQAVRAERFAFSETQQYLLVFKHNSLEIFKDDVSVWESGAEAVSVPWTSVQALELRLVQKFDAMFLFHKDVASYQLTRGTSDSTWTLAEIAWDAIPFYRFNIDQTLTPSGTTGSINLTLSSGDDYWDSTYVGVRINVNGGFAIINTITTGLVAAATVVDHLDVSLLDNTNADEVWREEAWGTHRGYPRCGTLHQNRLLIGGTRDAPQTNFASDTSDFLKFDGTDASLDDTSWIKEIGTAEVNTIRSIFGRFDVHIFTNAQEFTINGDNAITPSAGRIDKQTSLGIANVDPIEVGSDILFITEDGKTLQLTRFDADLVAFKTTNLTTLSQNQLNSPVSLAFLPNYMDTQANYVFVVNGDGTMSVLSIDVDKEVFGWSKFTTNGTFDSATVVDDALYVITTRNGEQYLEKLTEDDVYLDQWSVGTDSGGTTAFSGFTTLALQTVGAFISIQDAFINTGGVVHPDVFVDTGGNITLEETTKRVVIGHRYTATIETLPLAFAFNTQLVRGERIRLVECELRVRNTSNFTVQGFLVDERKLGTALLDGDMPESDTIVNVRIKGISTNPTVTIESADPLPLQVNGITTTVSFRGPTV